jgi:hypothetical protein
MALAPVIIVSLLTPIAFFTLRPAHAEVIARKVWVRRLPPKRLLLLQRVQESRRKWM